MNIRRPGLIRRHNALGFKHELETNNAYIFKLYFKDWFIRVFKVYLAENLKLSYYYYG